MQNFVVSKKIEVQIAKMSYFGFFRITVNAVLYRQMRLLCKIHIPHI